MSIAISFAGLTPDALSRLTAGERDAFGVSSDYLVADCAPPVSASAGMLRAVVRLLGELEKQDHHGREGETTDDPDHVPAR